MQLNKLKDEKRTRQQMCRVFFESSQGKRSDIMVKYKLIKSNQDVEIRTA